MTTFRDVPVVFLSYREDNAESNYNHLKKMVPNALRVQGVRGFDAAHKAALNVAQANSRTNTQFFITVDGDNRTFEEFWDILADRIYTEGPLIDVKEPDFVLSWNSYNPVTGLAYGNGGLKLWSYEFVRQMVTHESAGEPVVDFCWRPRYFQMHSIFSTTHINGSDAQAFTAGFREGVKMPLVGGKDHGSVYETKDKSYDTNLERLVTWCSVGQHEPHGRWSIVGALLGFLRFHVRKDIKLEDVSDIIGIHKYFQQFYQDMARTVGSTDELIKQMRAEVHSYTGLDIPLLGPKQSAFVVERTRPVISQDPFKIETWNPRLVMRP